MTTFVYTGKRGGKPVSGQLEANSKDEATKKLGGQGIVNLTIQVRTDKTKAAKPKKPPNARVKPEDLAVFTRQMCTMIGAGIPLLEGLEIMSEQAEDPGFSHVLRTVVESVRTGNDLSESLAAHPKVFEKIYVNMVKAGEASGQIDTILDRLAGYMEESAKLKGEIKSAMTYPVISLVMVLGIAVFLMAVVVPQFEEIFTALGAPLPAPTQIVLAISRSMTSNFALWAIGGVGLFFGVKFGKKTKKGQRMWDSLALKAPIIGPIATKVAISRFSRTFSTLLSSGVPILQALEIVAATSGNVLLEEAILAARDNVREGNELSGPLSQCGVFPLMVTRMISIGEKSGALEQLLGKVSEFYDSQVEQAIKSLTSLIEPIMIGAMGIIVGGIVLAIFLPIFDAPSHM
ncbi:MAG: type II secretion system F family protein [Planctomycetota bacterium]